jgi:putative restriction endonuclease
MSHGNMTWRQAVAAAIDRLTSGSASKTFTGQQLIDELDSIRRDTGTIGKTPSQTLSRVLQDLRDDGQIEFRSRGEYRVIVQDIY